MEQLLAHLIGDYWLQNDWMALNKKKRFWITLVHSTVYTIPFLFITQSIVAIFIILITHAVIDGTNLVNRLNQVKNWNFRTAVFQEEPMIFKNSPDDKYEYSTLYKNEIEIADGYNDRPLFIRAWLIIIQDNILHLLINFLAVKYF